MCHFCANGFVLDVHTLDIREPELEICGGPPTEGHAHSAPLLLSLLGTFPQHSAHLAALQAGPGCVQVR